MRICAARRPAKLASAAATVSIVAALLILAPACDKATPVAPADGTITISVNPTRIEIDGVATVTALATKMDGTPVNEGTEIFFSTTLGTIDEMVPTDDRGRAVATLRGDGRVGDAEVTATSGGVASEPLVVKIGSIAESITLQANPTRVPKTGGTVSLVATVRDDLNNPLPDLAVTFRTEAGTLASGGGTIDTNTRGEARDTLTLEEFDLAGLSEFLVFAETTGAPSGDGENGGSVGDLLQVEEIIGVAGFAFTIILTPTPQTIPETGDDVLLQAVVLDDDGEPAVDAAVIFGSDVGSLDSRGTPRFTDAEGLADDTLFVSEDDLRAFPGTSFQVSAETPGASGETIRTTDSIAVLRGQVTMLLDASPQSIPTGQNSNVTLTAVILDEDGDGIAGETIGFSTTLGSLNRLTVETGADGEAQNTLVVTSGEIGSATSITVSAEAIVLGTPVSATVIITIQQPAP